VDDNRTFLSSVRNFLSQVPGVEVIAEAYDGGMALELTARMQPDLVLLDIAMPGMSGMEAAGALNAFVHPPHIVFLSMHDCSTYRDAARDLGARGIFGKSDFVVNLIPLITEMVSDLKLRQSPGTPILATTANAFEEDCQACLESGMKDHIDKPVDPDKLFET
jgi:DNA-binding NarL/FixJ family response regulator